MVGSFLIMKISDVLIVLNFLVFDFRTFKILESMVFFIGFILIVFVVRLDFKLCVFWKIGGYELFQDSH